MIETFCHIMCPITVAFLSDTHDTDPGPILESLESRKPVLIAIAGDFVRGELAKNGFSKMQESPNTMNLLRGCAKIAPTFASPGNHERSLTLADLDIIAETGCMLLDNDMTEYNGIIIGGLSSAYYTEYKPYRSKRLGTMKMPKNLSYFRRQKPAPDIFMLDDFEKQDKYKILLCHHPEYYPLYLKERNINLILSGHCHGGQWRYYSLIHKEWRGVFSPGQGLFPSLTSGMYDGRLLVSRGLSNTTIIPRINNPEEVIYCVPYNKQ